MVQIKLLKICSEEDWNVSVAGTTIQCKLWTQCMKSAGPEFERRCSRESEPISHTALQEGGRLEHGLLRRDDLEDF